MPNEILNDISLDLIDDPQEPMRSAMDEEKLDELARSIRTSGLIQPVTLRKRGERYEVVAGHRRFRACKRLGLATISAVVREMDEKGADSIRMHENLYREDVNPVDEARHIRLMITKHGYAPEQLAEMTGKSVSYLRARYELLDFPEYIIAAVQEGTLGLTAAQWLNKITDDRVRADYTRFGIRGGLTAKRVLLWFQAPEAGSLPREASAFPAPPAEASVENRIIEMPCVLCRHMDDITKMDMKYAHFECVKATNDMQVDSKQ